MNFVTIEVGETAVALDSIAAIQAIASKRLNLKVFFIV